MTILERVKVQRFKSLASLDLPLTEVTVLIGANNSGKSSALQAIHFAASVAQSAQVIEASNWAQGRYATTLGQSQLLYTPISDVMAVATGGTLTQKNPVRIEFVPREAAQESCSVTLSRGKNKNLTVAIEGETLGRQLQDIAQPFSIYAPGLAGIPREERFMPMGLVRRIVARGDANLVLRNVLLRLSEDEPAWQQFHEDMKKLWPDFQMEIYFDEDTDETIDAEVSVGGPTVPLDAAGTSVLQASQLLGYTTLFKPKLLILDEPDSHIHPNNQRRLCDLIVRIATERDIQTIIATHSRHILDSMRDRASIVWLSQGTIVSGVDADTTSRLLDLGALDSLDYFADGELKCIVATEDSHHKPLKEVLWANGFDEDRTEIISYTGCTKLESAIVLGSFLRKKAPNIRVVVHRDRDYLPDDEVTRLATALKNNGIDFFPTRGNDIECYYLSAAHLAALNPDHAAIISATLDAARLATRDKSIEAITTQRIAEENRKKREGTGPGPNAAAIALQAIQDYDGSPVAMARGKIVRGKFGELFREATGHNPWVVGPSAHLADADLSAIASDIWNE